ncbi:MAG: response regulator [Sulfurimonadaceae bacterium]|nr:response regulator [Sulfurimonadaceae bacterium]
MNHGKQRVLIVDDIPENIQVLLSTLKSDFAILAATNGEKAIELAASDPQPDIILLDIMMPGMDGYEVCRRLKADESTQGIPVIFVTALTESDDEAKGLELGAVDYITKPINPVLVKSRVKNHLELKRHRDNLQELVDERTHQLKVAKEATIEAMGIVAENRDPETGGHIQRTKSYMKTLATKLSEHPKYAEYLTPEKIELFHHSAPLHDIGKVAISDKILLKPGPLDEEEFKTMKEHTIIGEITIVVAQNRLGQSDFLEVAKEIAGSHHEKWDGTGYPRGTRGEDIPLSARLMALSDVYDALISRRTYKDPVSHSKVVEIITNERGKHFDPDIVDAFLELQEEFRMIGLQFADNDDERNALKN